MSAMFVYNPTRGNTRSRKTRCLIEDMFLPMGFGAGAHGGGYEVVSNPGKNC